ncbi:MAG: cadherin repeat domain-containing protein, partial [Ekhidna sp.]|nr:cadherin repeat domain-containing protein [Ekhidna sp.]
SAQGTVIGTVRATDADGDDLTYRIASGNTGGAFAISNAGVLTVNGTINYERTQAYTLVVEVSDGWVQGSGGIWWRGLSLNLSTINVKFTNVNEYGPVVDNENFTITENTAQGTVIGTVRAKDGDGDDLTYRITSGNTGNAFAVSNAGVLTVNGTIDYETTQAYTLVVEVSDGARSSASTIKVKVTNVIERYTSKEFDLHKDNSSPWGLWSDGTTMWVVDYSDDKLYAYTLATGARDTSKEFDLHGDNSYPGGLWSDGTTMWVANEEPSNDYSRRHKLYAYTLATGVSDGSKDLSVNIADTNYPSGIYLDDTEILDLWSDGTTMWVLGITITGVVGYPPDIYNRKLYAYTLATGARDTSKEFDLDRDNRRPLSSWSDGTTMWVADYVNDKLYAYTLATGARDTSKEFDLDRDNGSPLSSWSDGTTMWVADYSDDKLYAYELPK